MKTHSSIFNMMSSDSFNNYSSAILLENSLLLANDKTKSLEGLLASKDFIIYQMSMCNAFMAHSIMHPISWTPPLLTYPPSKEGNEAEADCVHSDT